MFSTIRTYNTTTINCNYIQSLVASVNPQQKQTETHNSKYETRNPKQKNSRYYLGNYEKEINHVTNTTTEYYYISGPITNIAVYIRKNGAEPELYYTITDHLGSIVAITDKNGEIIEEQRYNPWGVYSNAQTGAPEETPQITMLYRGYTGHEMLPEFGLINMNGRLYDPVIARVLSPDNNVQNPNNPQNYNRYSYCYNNPLSYTDPDGEFVWFVPVIAGAVIGAYTGASIQSGTAAFWDWQPDTWKGAIAGAIVGATLGYGISGAIGASGMTTVAANGATVATKSAGIISSMLNSGSINIAMNAMSGGGWDGAWRAGVVGLATGGWNATGGFGMVKGFGSTNSFAQLGGKLGYQMIGTAGASIGNNWARGEDPLSKVTLGVGPVNLTLGKEQKLFQWQNNIGNIATNAFGLVNLAFRGKVNFDWKNLSLNYSGGIIDKFYPPTFYKFGHKYNQYAGFGAHSVMGNSRLLTEPDLYSHELHHLWQSRAFGDTFLLNYGLQGIGAMLMGGSFLQEYNYFEDQAYGEYWW
ncbi:MAG: RHS repeat-associated core domain-containing protein [Bacteroidales bacterium]|nr:RHS repeat-associated core domain-containing protein [Bacteroidales bacterium]